MSVYKSISNKLFEDQQFANKWLLMTSSFLFLFINLFDFVAKEPLLPLYFLARFSIFTLIMLFASSINYKMFTKHYRIITCIGLTTINMFTIAFTLTSETNNYINLGLLSILYLGMTIFYNPATKFFLPPIFIPFISFIFFKDYFPSELKNSNVIFGFISFLSLTSFAFHRISNIFRNLVFNLKKQISLLKNESNILIDENRELIRVLCHDLGNSITIVGIAGRIIEDIEIADEVQNQRLKKTVAKIIRATENQKDLIEHVKEKEALQSGKRHVPITPVNLKAVFDKALFTFEKQLKEKNINLVLNFQNNQAPYVMAEMVSLSNNVINNIISNAIKFSYDDSQIIVSTWEDNGQVLITIEDFGIGMGEDLLKDIFSNHKITSRKGLNGEKGTGFGMPIVKSYMQQYGGDVFVESKENKGTRFILTFKSLESKSHTTKLIA